MHQGHAWLAVQSTHPREAWVMPGPVLVPMYVLCGPESWERALADRASALQLCSPPRFQHLIATFGVHAASLLPEQDTHS